jgi:hypothetical protein
MNYVLYKNINYVILPTKSQVTFVVELRKINIEDISKVKRNVFYKMYINKYNVFL